MLKEDIIAIMGMALQNHEFVVYYQPQYNHINKALVGAEALIRWIHPELGVLPPKDFLPVFEETGFITKVDLYVFDEVCRYQRKCLDGGITPIPISVNTSRLDIHHENFIDSLETIRKQYDIPPRLLHIEITESSAAGGKAEIRNAVNKLHMLGYKVEMDDFGTGFSSLSILKDIPFDFIKLDMQFFQDDLDERGGIIVMEIVRMAKWLKTPVIAEGVETVDIADYMRSIGCPYIQGYLYHKPIPETDFTELLKNHKLGEFTTQLTLVELMDNASFWNPKSLDTFIFNNYVGASAIYTYKPSVTDEFGEMELLRINNNFMQELDFGLKETDFLRLDLISLLDKANLTVYKKMLDKAIVTGHEAACDTSYIFESKLCGGNVIRHIRTYANKVGKIDDKYIIFARIVNITKEVESWQELEEDRKKFKIAADQINEFAWKCDLLTKDMYPCTRCQEVLGLPKVLHNYPEPAIESGLFPEEIADEYRDWFKRMSLGEKEIEGILPLTQDRIPFNIKYTVIFDDKGNPVTAYASAALVKTAKD